MIKLHTPNLDAELDPEELVEFVKNLDHLAAYALTKASAMQLRMAGNVEAALKHERRCEMIYNLLPLSWRW